TLRAEHSSTLLPRRRSLHTAPRPSPPPAAPPQNPDGRPPLPPPDLVRPPPPPTGCRPDCARPPPRPRTPGSAPPTAAPHEHGPGRDGSGRPRRSTPHGRSNRSTQDRPPDHVDRKPAPPRSSLGNTPSCPARRRGHAPPS